MKLYLGIDTSNYTTSVGIVNDKNKVLFNEKMPLSVKTGEVGLRQSEAVFQHNKNIKELIKKAFSLFNSKDIVAVGVSSKPRNTENSYMPCFLVGQTAGVLTSLALQVNYYEFSHQEGHLAAAIVSAKRFELLKNDFIGFHVSGGTTEVLFVKPSESDVFDISILSKTLDISAGQAIDRIGVKLGLPFPAGKHLDLLAVNSSKKHSVKTSVKNDGFNLSGLENQADKMILQGEAKEDVAKYCIDFIKLTLKNVIEKNVDNYKDETFLFSGGVMCNSIIRKEFESTYKCFFAESELSSDNAVGIAFLTKIKEFENA